MSVVDNRDIKMSMIAHKGEVVIVFTAPVGNLAWPPQVARDLAQSMIKLAELAEQQMDEERE